MKRLFRKLHLIIGLTSGLVVFILSITGCINSFEEELRSYFYADLFKVEKQNEIHKSIDELTNNAQLHWPEKKIRSIKLRTDVTQSLEVQFQNKTSLFINPYTGTILGSLDRNKDFFGRVLTLHRSLFLDDLGKWIIGISTLLFLFMLVSGIVIWWPPKKRNRREKFILKKSSHWYKRNYDLHNILGFYASWFILFTVLTGLIWSFSWAEKSLYFVTNSKKEPRFEINSKSEQTSEKISLTTIYKLSCELYPSQEECQIMLPEKPKESIRVTLRYGNGGFFRRQDFLYFDQFTGKLLANKPFHKTSLGSKLKMSNLKIHSGKEFGLIGQWVVFFASLICASLPITGFLIWKNKRKF